MTENSLKELEANINSAKEAIELGSALERLYSNRDFKKVVINGYFEKEAVRLVHLKAMPAYVGVAEQKNIIDKIDAIGNFSNYLKDIEVATALAIKTVGADEQTHDEIIFEGSNNG